MQYDLEVAVRRNWALLTIADYQESFYEMFGFVPSQARVRRLIKEEKIDVVRHEGRIYVVMNDKSTYDIKPHKSDYVLFKKSKYGKAKFVKIKEALPNED